MADSENGRECGHSVDSKSDVDVWEMLTGSAEDVEGDVAPTVFPAIRPVAAQEPAAPAPPATTATASASEAPKAAAKLAASPPVARPTRKTRGGVPAEIAEDAELLRAIAEGLPSNYEFEVPRTVWRLQKASAKHIGLQLPEGLTSYATALADIFRDFVPSVETTTILGDVTFGACCIEDLSCQAVGVDFLVHYGHSCLVPTDQTTLNTLYIHVEIDVNVAHLVETVRLNFTADKRIALMGSVQFTAGAREAAAILAENFFADGDGAGQVPQVKPLGLGETLGCTSPAVDAATDAVVFVCDGRFHLESAMIQNPHVKDGFFRYDPFALTLTREGYAHDEMHRSRKAAIQTAKRADFVGLILGTLGRQGSVGVLEEVARVLDERNIPHMTLLLSEVSPERLALFESVGAWVQVACPRLSLDWGDAYGTPLLTPYEAHVAFGGRDYQAVYPMDYYSNKGGPWSNYGAKNGHGGTVSDKFRHLRRDRKRLAVGYEGDAGL